MNIDFNRLGIPGYKIEVRPTGRVVLRQTRSGWGWDTEAFGELVDGEWIISNRQGCVVNLGEASQEAVIEYMWNNRGTWGVEGEVQP